MIIGFLRSNAEPVTNDSRLVGGLQQVDIEPTLTGP
jgi:hypothetical protein